MRERSREWRRERPPGSRGPDHWPALKGRCVVDALRLPQDPKSLVKDQLVNPAPRGRNWRATRLLPVALGLLLLAASWAPAMADDAFDLINELMCPSDCVETLAICQMTEAAQMRTLIK